MKRLLLIACLLGLLTSADPAATARSAGDGTLSVRDGRGTFMINARGGIIGSFARGRVIITDPVEGDGTGPIVSGEEYHKELSDTADMYRGTRVRFRLIGGFFKVRVIGRGVNLSVVGRGTVVLKGEGTIDDGSYSVNGGDTTFVPDFSSFPLSAPPPH